MSGPTSRRAEYRCSFCDKSNEQVRRLIAGPRAVYICDGCTQQFTFFLLEDRVPANLQGSVLVLR
jgi:ATP-dependent Clp protease ATP-binding subunit ClpX